MSNILRRNFFFLHPKFYQTFFIVNVNCTMDNMKLVFTAKHFKIRKFLSIYTLYIYINFLNVICSNTAIFMVV